MKKILLTATIAFLFLGGFSQNANDALRYSSISYGGTARFMGLSGAYGAVGADFSSLSQNPAGIALYRKSEFTITPGFYSAGTQSEYYNEKQSDSRTNMIFGNLGMVMCMNMNNNKKDGLIKGVQFGFGMNRLNNFSNRISIAGFNDKSSLLGQYAEEANNGGTPIQPGSLDKFSTLLAYNTNLLVYDSATLQHSAYYWVDMPNGNVLQTKTIEILGSSHEMLMSGGANFGNKLYLGLSLSFPSIRYEETSNFTEQDSKRLSSNINPDFNFLSVSRSEKLTTKGTGFNMKFGIIYKPVNFIRIGAAFHSRTTYNLSDDFSSGMVAYFENGSEYSASSPKGAYDYRLTTPFRAIGSLAIIIGKSALISADYEYVDYSTSSLHADDYSFYNENTVIKSSLTAANNLRFGAEWKYNIFAFRAGTSFYGSPYKNETTRGARMGYSAGFGVHEQNYSLDFAFNHQLSKDDYFLYGSSSDASANNTLQSNQFQLTLGMHF